MLKKVSDFLGGLPMTIAAGLFLLLELVPHLTEEFGGTPMDPNFLPFDPAWVTVIISGIPLLYLAVWRLIHNPGISKISSALLIIIAMFAAIAIGDLFAAGEVAFIMAVGAILEEMTTNRAKKGLKNLISLTPTQGRRLKDGKEELIPAEQIRQGDVLRILPGETIPVDGKIIAGETSVDQSIMTGESLPVDKSPGDDVFCGTINRFGSIDITSEKVGGDSSLQKLIHMMQEAEKKQAPMQRIADRAASWLVPVALMIAAGAYIGTGNIVTAVTVLVVFCPCALVLATPTAAMEAIGQAAKHGVVIKSGEALEKMGKAIVSCAREKGLPLMESTAFKMTAGRGIDAEVAGKRLLCGNEKFLLENGVMIDGSVRSVLEKLREEGKASIFVADGGQCAGSQDRRRRRSHGLHGKRYCGRGRGHCADKR